MNDDDWLHDATDRLLAALLCVVAFVWAVHGWDRPEVPEPRRPAEPRLKR